MLDDVASIVDDMALVEGDVTGANPRPKHVHMWGCWDGAWMRMKVSSDWNSLQSQSKPVAFDDF